MNDDSSRARRRLTRRPPGWAVVAALATAGLTSSFMFTLIIPLQAELPVLLDAPREHTSWVVTITLLLAAIATPISGRLGDMYGKRRVTLVLLIALLIGSVIAAFSTSIITLLIGRGMQGLTTGVIPLGIAIMRDVLPPARLGTAVALMSATMGVGAGLGLPFAAFIAEVSDWHALFWVSAALGVICFLAILFLVPEDVLLSPGRFDYFGALGLAVALTGVLLYISQGADWGWVSPVSLAVLGVGILVLAFWVFHQLRKTDPLVDLRVSVRPSVLFTNLAAFGMGFALFASNVLLPQLLELPRESGSGFGLTMFEAALCITPAGLIMMALSPLSGRLERVFGARALLRLGILMIVIAYAFLLFFSNEVWHIVVANCIIGVGIAFAFAAMPMIIMRSVPADETGVSNGLNALFRSLGTSSASAIVGAVLATVSTNYEGALIPSREAFTISFWIALAAAIASSLLSLAIPKHPRHRTRSALDGT